MWKNRLTVVKVEQKTTHVFVIDLSSAVSLVLGDDLQETEIQKVVEILTKTTYT